MLFDQANGEVSVVTQEGAMLFEQANGKVSVATWEVAMLSD